MDEEQIKKALIPLALKAWAILTALLLAWGIVAVFLLRGAKITERGALDRIASIDATNRSLEEAIKSNASRIVVITKTVEVAKESREIARAGFSTNRTIEAAEAVIKSDDFVIRSQADLIKTLSSDNDFYRRWNTGLQAKGTEEAKAWNSKLKTERLKWGGIGLGAGAVAATVIVILARSSIK